MNREDVFLERLWELSQSLTSIAGSLANIAEHLTKLDAMVQEHQHTIRFASGRENEIVQFESGKGHRDAEPRPAHIRIAEEPKADGESFFEKLDREEEEYEASMRHDPPGEGGY